MTRLQVQESINKLAKSAKKSFLSSRLIRNGFQYSLLTDRWECLNKKSITSEDYLILLEKDSNEWDFEDAEITEIINNIKPTDSKPWLDYHNWLPKDYRCTCGSEKVYGKGATHSDWCDSL